MRATKRYIGLAVDAAQFLDECESLADIARDRGRLRSQVLDDSIYPRLSLLESGGQRLAKRLSDEQLSTALTYLQALHKELTALRRRLRLDNYVGGVAGFGGTLGFGRVLYETVGSNFSQNIQAALVFATVASLWYVLYSGHRVAVAGELQTDAVTPVGNIVKLLSEELGEREAESHRAHQPRVASAPGMREANATDPGASNAVDDDADAPNSDERRRAGQ